MTPIIISRYSPQVLCFHKSLFDKGMNAGFICIMSPKEPRPTSKYFKNLFYIDQKELFTPDGIDRIKLFTNRFESCGLVSINEKISGWLWENSEALGENCTLLMPEKDILFSGLSKKRQIETAAESGFSVLPTYLITKEPKSYCDIRNEHFPICLRPSAPGAVKPFFKVKVIQSFNELKVFLSNIDTVNKYIIAQPFLNLPNLVVHGSRKKSGESIGVQGFLVDRKFEGVTLTIKPVCLKESLKEKCLKFVELFQINGPYHFEFLYDPVKQEEWFLEINNRLGGTTAKVFACGYDEISYLLKSYGVELPESAPPRNVTASSKLALLKYIQFILTNKITPLDFPADETKFQSIVQALRGLIFHKDDILNLKDLKGSIAFYMHTLNNRII